jgi:glycerophosphodiester phosphodiesterase
LRLLLDHNALVDFHETINLWTALDIAAIQGHKNVVEILIKAGAERSKSDLSNWTAIDHAGWRGHLEIAEMLKSHNEKSPSVLNDGYAAANESKTEGAGRPSPTPVVPRGHTARASSVLQNESQIIVHLGSWDRNKNTPVLILTPEASLAAASASYPMSCFSIGVSITGGTGSNYVVRLPLVEDTTNIPLIFSTMDPSQFKLVFDLYCSSSDTSYTNDEKKVLLGSGIALPMCLQQSLGPERESLIRDYTIPILERKTLKYIAAVTFSFLVASPFSHRETLPIATHALWNVGGPTKVIGHRGIRDPSTSKFYTDHCIRNGTEHCSSEVPSTR